MFFNNKTYFIVGFIVSLVIIIELIIIFFPGLTLPIKTFVQDLEKISFRLKPATQTLPSMHSSVGLQEFKSATPEKNWLIYRSKEQKYSFLYPPEFTLKELGKNAKNQFVTVLFHKQGNKKYTAATFSMGTNDKKISKITIKKGSDGNLNRTAEYLYPFQDKLLSILFTLYGRNGSSFSYEDVSTKIVKELKFYTY